MDKLIGLKITALSVNEDQRILCFASDGKLQFYKTYGDCCSETWFADIVNPEALLGNVITSVEELKAYIDESNERSRQDVDKVYGYRLKTNKGDTDIIFRNSSNGYYGGYIEFKTLTEVAPEVTSHVWTMIKTDWRA